MYLGPPVEGVVRPLKTDLQSAPYANEAANGPLRSDTLLWQSFSPELRAEVLRRAQLVQLLQQVNPKLQLCQESQPKAPPAPQKVTAEKGIQVPDVRFGSAPYRPKRLPTINKPTTPAPQFNNTYTGPGIRIYNPVNQPDNRFGREGPNKDHILHGRAANRSFQHTRSSSAPRSYHRGPPNYPPRNMNSKPPRRYGCSSTNNPSAKRPEDEVSLPKENKDNEHKMKSQLKNGGSGAEKNSCVMRNDKKDQNETQSSDDEVTVVVEIKSEQELERKFGQFYCRKCRRGWSSKNVWCVKLTSKVYIKQTCNRCNKIVNPFTVTSQPGANNN